MAVIVKPRQLYPGSTIGIIAPSGPPDKRRLRIGTEFLRNSGYKVRIFPQVKRKIGYLAGDDVARAEALNSAFADKEINAVFCARGGYGSLRILPFLDFNIIAENPKILLGYSDITVLLLSIYNRTELVTFHGPMPAVEFGRRARPFTKQQFYDSLLGSHKIRELKTPKGYRIEIISGGSAEGRIVGGNLSLMTKLIGTGHLPLFKNRVVFFEDTEEEAYRIDGYLAQLFQATDFGSAAGYIIGEFTRTETKYGQSSGWSVRQVIRDYFVKLKTPCIYGFPCGHGREKITIPIGIRARLDADNKRVVFLESGVKK